MAVPIPRFFPLAALFLVAPAASGALGPSPPAPALAAPEFELDSSAVWAAATQGAVRLSTPLGRFAFDLQARPLASGAVIGENGVPVDRVDRVVTFEGTASGYPARLAATHAGVFALVFAPDPILIEPAWLSQPGAPLALHRVALWSQAPPVIQDGEMGVGPSSGGGGSQAASTEPANRTVHFLLEGDFEFYRRASLLGNCADCWVEVQQAVMNIAEGLFAPQTGVSFEITSQWACTSMAGCPYVGVSDVEWLAAFRNRWESVADEPPHELGHLFSGTDLGPGTLGVAYGASVNSPRGYALSEVLAGGTGGINWGGVNAHEIGHNFNATHAEADPIPPSLVPTGVAGVVWTIMAPGQIFVYQFSDGTWDPTHNNLARIIAHAVERLPP